MPPTIEVEGLTRWFGSGPKRVHAVDDVSFSVAEGQTVALLGSNGAGKTTLTKMLVTLLTPTSGTARVLGHDVVRAAAQVRRVTGVVFGGDRGLYTRLSGEDNLRFFAMLAGVSRQGIRRRVPSALDGVGLGEAAGRLVETYSKGMRQRLHIAIGLIARPQVLLLDEPTVGLDPLEAERLRDSILGLRTDGVTVLLTSHYLLDVERLAERVVVLDHGRVASDVSLAEFVAEAGYVAVVEIDARGRLPDLGALLPAGVSVDRTETNGAGYHLSLRLRQWGAGVFGQLGALLDGIDLVDVQVRPARLEEAYARLSGQDVR